MNPTGRRCLGGLGSRLHAHVEQFTASRSAGNKEMSEPGGVGNTSVYSGVPAGGSSVIHYDNGLFYKENWETSSAQISGLL